MSSSEEDEPIRLRSDDEDSEEGRPKKRRKMAAKPLRGRGLGFVGASTQDADQEDEEEEEEDYDDARPGMGGLGSTSSFAGLGASSSMRSAFNIGQYNGEVEDDEAMPSRNVSASPEPQRPLGPSAFGAGGKINKSSFAARMMAKQGYVEGQGLGKHGQGISAPIQAKVLRQGEGLGAGSAPERPAKPKHDKMGGLSSGRSTPRLKGPPKTKYAVAALESRGLHVPEAMKMIIIDATGTETKTVSSVSGFSTPTSEDGVDTQKQNATRRIQRTLEQFGESWDSIKEQEAQLQKEQSDLRHAAETYASELQRYQDLVSAFERVAMDDSNQARTWDQMITRLQTIQTNFSDYMEDLDLPSLAVSALESPFRHELANWDPLNDPTHLVSSLQSISTLLAIPKLKSSTHRKRTTPFESLLLLHWYPHIRSTLQHSWNIYDPSPAIELIEAWTPIIPPWLLYNLLSEIILPHLISAVQKFPKRYIPDPSNPPPGSRSSKSSKADPLKSWLFEWWPLLSSTSLNLEHFPTLISLIKSKLDTTSYPDWKPVLKSTAPPKQRRPHPETYNSSTFRATSPTPAKHPADVEEVTFKDQVAEWAAENNLTLSNTGQSTTRGQRLYRLRHAEKRSGGVLVYLEGDIVWDTEEEPYGFDDGKLLAKVIG